MTTYLNPMGSAPRTGEWIVGYLKDFQMGEQKRTIRWSHRDFQGNWWESELNYPYSVTPETPRLVFWPTERFTSENAELVARITELGRPVGVFVETGAPTKPEGK